MKKMILNIMASIGIILLVLSVIATLYGGKVICIDTIFQIAILSVFIHLGLMVVHKIDISNPVLGILLDISYIVVITLLIGGGFHWYRTIPVWVLIIMVFVIYLVGYLIDIYCTKEEVRAINKLLQNRNEAIK